MVHPADERNDGAPQRPCVSPDSDSALSLPQAAECTDCVRNGDGALPIRSSSVIVPIDGLKCRRCERTVERRLNRIAGVRATVSYPAAAVRIDSDPGPCPLPEVDRALRSLGCRADFEHVAWQAPRAGGAGDVLRSASGRLWHAYHAVKGVLSRSGRLSLVVAGGVALLTGWIVSMLGGPEWLRIGLLAASAILSSTETSVEAMRTLRRFGVDVDVLMFVAAIGAAILGHYEEGAFLLWLFGLGTAGENLALNRARQAISALTQLAPDTAHRVGPDGAITDVAAETVSAGDRIVVRPFERFPVDGEVEQGESTADQSTITGESRDVDKAAGDQVFAGTVNGAGTLTIRVSKPASDSTLARIVRLVEEAQVSRSPTQLFTDRIERWYVPLVFVATALLIVLPPVFELGSWGEWFYRSMAFLTAASPCALAIGTPAAVLCGIARAGRIGVIIKGGAYMETLGRVRAIAFDKTGTLTEGTPSVTRVETFGVSEQQALQWAASIEREISHPLADPIIAAATVSGIDVPAASDVRQIPGRGASGVIGGVRIFVGKPDEAKSPEPLREAVRSLRAAGQTVVAVVADDRTVAVLGLADRLREGSSAVIDELHDLGVDHIAMLTGDHADAASSIARGLSLDAIEAELTP